MFKTITDDITGANKSIGLFGLSLTDARSKLNSIKTEGFIDSIFNTSSIDKGVIDKYNSQINMGISAQTALEQASRGANEATIQLMKSANGAVISEETLTAAMKANTVAAKAGSAAIKGVSIAMNMLAGIAIAAAISAIISGIDSLVHRTERIKEAAAEAQTAIRNAQDTLKTMSDTITENKDRFLELSEGVDKFSHNLKLSEEDYAEYLAISQKLAEIAPSLVIGYDEQGNALLDIGNNAEETTRKLNGLLETQQDITKQTLADNLDSVAQGVHVEVTESKGEITRLKQELDALEKESGEIQFDIADVVKNGNSIFQFNDANDPLRKYRTAFIESLESANIGWEDVGNDQILVNDFSSARNNGGKDGYEIRDIALQEAQNYYNAKLNLENNTHNASIAGLKEEIAEKENLIKSSYSKMTANLQAWTEDNYSYRYLSDSSQNIVDALIPNIRWDDLDIDLLSGADYENYINEHILTPLMAVKPENKAEVNRLFADLLSFEDGDLDIIPFAQQLQKKLNEFEIDIDISPIITDEQESYDRLQKSISSIAADENGSFTTSYGDKVNQEDYKTLQEYTKNFKSEQAELWNTATLGAENAADAVQMYKEALNSSSNRLSVMPSSEYLTQVQSLSNGFGQLSSIYSDVADSGSFDWSSIINNESFKQEFEELGSVYDDFIQTISNSPDDISACQSSFDKLASTYLYNSDILKNLTADTKDATVSMLEQMGISNALEIVTNNLTLNEQTLADAKYAAAQTAQALTQSAVTEVEAKEAVRLSNINLENATLSEINDLIMEADQLGISSGALINFKLAKFDVSRQSLNLMEDVSSLLAMAKAANISSQAVVALANAQAGYNAAKKSDNEMAMRYWAAQMDGQRKLVESQVANFQVPTVEVSPYPKQSSANLTPSAAAPAETKETFNFIETAINRISSAIDKLKSKAEETFSSFTSRGRSYSEAIKKISEELSIQEQAMQKYTANRDNVGLDESWAAQVRDGSLNIAEVSDSSLKEKIQEYQKWNDMVNECSDSISDLKKEQDELTRDKLELLITKYEKLSAKAANANERIQNKIDLKESWGGSASTKDYAKMNKNLSKQVGYTMSQNSELKQLQKTVTKGSEAWYDYQEQIDKNNASVQDLTKSMVENAKAAAALAKEKADAKVEKYDSKDELYDAKIENATTSKSKNDLIDKKIDNINNRQSAYDSAYNTSGNKLKSVSSSISGMKKKSTKTKSAATNKANQTYNNVLAKVKTKVKAGEKIPADLLEKARNLKDNAKLYNACIQYNEYFDAKAENKEIADIFRETSQQDKAELTLEKFNNTAESYDNSLRSGQQQASVINNRISLANEQGKTASASDYKELIGIEEKNQKTLIDKRNTLQNALNEAVKNGSVKENSEEWYEMKDAIDAVTNEIDESTRSVVEYQNAIRQLEWDKFDKGMETLKRSNSERDYQINMLSHKKLVDDETGDFTDEGQTTLSLKKSNYQNYLAQAAEYQKEYKNLQSQIAKGELDADDEKVIARLRELEDAHHDVMLSAEDEKDSIANLIKEGYDAQLNSLSKLIQKYKDLRQNAKDAYEYQKSLSEKTKNIASLQKQLAAYGSNNTEEARAKIQQLKVDLESAQQDLKDTEYEKYLSDTNDMLDELYSDYEAFIDKKLEDTDKLLENIDSSIANMSDSVSTVLSSINQTTEDLIKALTASPSPQIQDIYPMGMIPPAVPNPISDMALPKLDLNNSGYGNAVTISMGDIVLQDVQNPEQFSRQLVTAIADNSRVQRSIQSVSVERLVKSNGLSVNRYK